MSNDRPEGEGVNIVAEPLVNYGALSAPRWFGEYFRLLLRWKLCECRKCDYCKETTKLADRWLEEHDGVAA